MSTLLRIGRSWFVVLALLTVPLCARAHDANAEMVDAAKNFVAALTPEQQAKAVFELKSGERFNWDFVPHERNGLPLKQMTSAQRALAHALLNSGLSQRGYAKAVTIMSLDQILFDIEKQTGPVRDPELYYVTIFGKPATDEAWGWRVEGHHLSVNFTVLPGQIVASAPLFLGSNPAEVRSGPRTGLRVLGHEDDMGRELISALTDDQKKVAIYANTAPNEIITGKKRKVSALSPVGVAEGDMTAEQKTILHNLVSDYAHRVRTELAESDLKRIEAAGWGKVSFAWAGGIEPGKGHYYRVQGPTFLLEFDNTQNDANHIHTVWRDLEHDFGEDLLLKHYQETPHDK